jgi:beta-lactamase class A
MKRVYHPPLIDMRYIILAAAALAFTASSVDAQDTTRIMRRLRALEAETGGTIGVHARHLESGRTVSLRGSRPFFMASVTKFPLAVHILREVERGRISLADTVTITQAQMSPGRSPIREGARGGAARVSVEALIRGAVSDSDNTANDALQRLGGGPGAVGRTLRALGIRGIRVDRPYTALAGTSRVGASDPRDTATPEAATALLAALQNGRALNRANTARLLGWMTQSRNPTTRIVAGVPAGAVVAHKTGTWTGANDAGLSALNDVGIITLPRGRGHLAVAIFVRNTPKGMVAVDPAVARITRALVDELSPARR